MSPGREIKNLGASIRARLLNMARRSHIDFNRILLIYFQQSFLERLAHSRYKKQFILKGGLLFYGVEPLLARPTRDIDFLGKGLINQPAKIEAVMQEIISIPLPDGVTFFTESIHSEIITERKSYSGVRIFVAGELSGARQTLQIDVGFGDVVIPAPVPFHYPVLLRDEGIQIYAYSWSSVIAEKLEAIVSLGHVSSRMKDYYDIFYLQNRFNFDGAGLSRAIKETFQHRGTEFSGVNYIFSDEFTRSPSKQTQWQAFLRKNYLNEPDKFSWVIDYLKRFLSPVVSALIGQEEFKKRWDFEKRQCA